MAASPAHSQPSSAMSVRFGQAATAALTAALGSALLRLTPRRPSVSLRCTTAACAPMLASMRQRSSILARGRNGDKRGVERCVRETNNERRPARVCAA